MLNPNWLDVDDLDEDELFAESLEFDDDEEDDEFDDDEEYERYILPRPPRKWNEDEWN